MQLTSYAFIEDEGSSKVKENVEVGNGMGRVKTKNLPAQKELKFSFCSLHFQW